MARPVDSPERVDERALTERLIGYDTSDAEGIRKAAGFVKGWLESRDIPVEELEIRGLPVLAASVGRRATARRVVLHGHLDVVPGRAEQFEPAGRGRPPLRPRRLRHEGRAGGDDGRASQELRDAARRARGARGRARRGVRGGGRPRHRVPDPERLHAATSRSPASRPTCTSACRRRACSRCGSRWAARPPTARRRGSATTRS